MWNVVDYIYGTWVSRTSSKTKSQRGTVRGSGQDTPPSRCPIEKEFLRRLPGWLNHWEDKVLSQSAHRWADTCSKVLVRRWCTSISQSDRIRHGREVSTLVVWSSQWSSFVASCRSVVRVVSKFFDGLLWIGRTDMYISNIGRDVRSKTSFFLFLKFEEWSVYSFVENWNICVGQIIGWENDEANYSRPLLKLLDTTTRKLIAA